ncbi:Glucose dehydrogenase [Penaeus vannamei]|uniref:Glucose dehydrogenase n=1 Tax=Penaeus vannamei TaxID=6689 RepID=A0A423TIA0_PENVA|nr:Glucose dehydrogenase [Penaeus vannamei]
MLSLLTCRISVPSLTAGHALDAVPFLTAASLVLSEHARTRLVEDQPLIAGSGCPSARRLPRLRRLPERGRVAVALPAGGGLRRGGGRARLPRQGRQRRQPDGFHGAAGLPQTRLALLERAGVPAAGAASTEPPHGPPRLRHAGPVRPDAAGEEGRGQEVRARREVILAAGAINTPQLLLLSGVGPAQQLRLHNISVVADLPVGRNLQDHIAGNVIFTIKEPVSLLYSRLENLPALLKYSAFGSGPLTSLGGVEGVAFVSTRFVNASLDWPDIEFHFVSGTHASDGGSHLRHALGLRDEYWSHYFSHLVDRDQFSILAKLMRPRSRGVVELRSADPYEYPKITTNYLHDRADLLVVKEGLKIARQVGNTRVFREFGARLFDLPLPGCESFEVTSEAYWECYIRHLTFTIYHYCGTAKMGPYWDPNAVVDPKLRVYGVQGLRVVDASIFPTIPSGNTNAPVTMVAEKAAHMIKAFWASAKTAGDARPPKTPHSEEL